MLLDNKRNSNLELLRIISMLVIVAHHYVVNSGLLNLVRYSTSVTANDVFLSVFGWGGKTGINCFILITGYFMCTSQITLRKFLKLICAIEFYNIMIYAIFAISGYEAFSVAGFAKAIMPITSITDGFVSCFLIFYLFIPFLNKLIQSISEHEHLRLLVLCVCVCTILPSFEMEINMSYVAWFCVIYIIASYLRLYPKPWFANEKLWRWLAFGSLAISWASVAVITIFGRKIGIENQYFFVADSNKILALVTAVCWFMLFNNLDIKNSVFINTVAASTFGVLLIHANSATMRHWLWRDTLRNVNYYNSDILILHAFASVLGVYIVCTLIDCFRLRWIETPLLKRYDKHFSKQH